MPSDAARTAWISVVWDRSHAPTDESIAPPVGRHVSVRLRTRGAVVGVSARRAGAGRARRRPRRRPCASRPAHRGTALPRRAARSDTRDDCAGHPPPDRGGARVRRRARRAGERRRTGHAASATSAAVAATATGADRRAGDGQLDAEDRDGDAQTSRRRRGGEDGGPDGKGRMASLLDGGVAVPHRPPAAGRAPRPAAGTPCFGRSPRRRRSYAPVMDIDCPPPRTRGLRRLGRRRWSPSAVLTVLAALAPGDDRTIPLALDLLAGARRARRAAHDDEPAAADRRPARRARRGEPRGDAGRDGRHPGGGALVPAAHRAAGGARERRRARDPGAVAADPGCRTGGGWSATSRCTRRSLGWGAYGRARAAAVELWRERAQGRRARAGQARPTRRGWPSARGSRARCTTRSRTGSRCWRPRPARSSTGPTSAPSRSRSAAGVVRTEASAALGDLRDVIGLLRDEPDELRPVPASRTCRRSSASGARPGMAIELRSGAPAADPGRRARRVPGGAGGADQRPPARARARGCASRSAAATAGSPSRCATTGVRRARPSSVGAGAGLVGLRRARRAARRHARPPARRPTASCCSAWIPA